MEKHIYNSLKNDVLKLFSSIHHSSLEDIYIKLAEGIDNEDNSPQSQFSKWLISNKKIRNSLSNPAVYDAFLLLIDLKNRYPNGIKYNEIIREFMNKGVSGQSILISFADYLSNHSVQSILQPYADILTTSTSVKGIAKQDVLNDLQAIKGQFERYLQGEDTQKPLVQKKQSIYQQRKNMYDYLLNRFSGELSNAANSASLPEIAEKLGSGMLSKPIPVGLGRYIEFDPISVENAKTAKIMSEQVWKYFDSKWGNYNHDIIELTFLNKAGSISKEDFMRLRIEHEQKPNKEEGMGIENVTIDKRLNGDFIYMLSMLFVFLEQKLGVPGILG